jgi:hypothetical protein
MTLDEAVHFFNGVVGNLLDVGMAALAFHLKVNALVKDILVDIKQAKVAIFIDPAEARVLVTQQTVSDIGGTQIQRQQKRQQQQAGKPETNEFKHMF